MHYIESSIVFHNTQKKSRAWWKNPEQTQKNQIGWHSLVWENEGNIMENFF